MSGAGGVEVAGIPSTVDVAAPASVVDEATPSVVVAAADETADVVESGSSAHATDTKFLNHDESVLESLVGGAAGGADESPVSEDDDEVGAVTGAVVCGDGGAVGGVDDGAAGGFWSVVVAAVVVAATDVDVGAGVDAEVDVAGAGGTLSPELDASGVDVAGTVVLAIRGVLEAATFVLLAPPPPESPPPSLLDASTVDVPPPSDGARGNVIEAVSVPTLPPPSPLASVPVGAPGKTTFHESTNSADWKFLPSRSAIFWSPEKLPQNICAVAVENTAALSGVKAESGAPGARSGLPSAFATLSQLPKHDDG